MKSPLELDDADFVMNLSNHCNEYIEYVEVRLVETPTADAFVACDTDEEWWRSKPHANGDHFIGLTAEEARSLDNACIAWLDRNVMFVDEGEDPAVVQESLLEEDPYYSYWFCDVCEAAFDDVSGRWSCEACNWQWNICEPCMGNVTRQTTWPGACIACQRNSGIWGHTDEHCPGDSEAIKAHPHCRQIKSVETGIARTGERVCIAAARAKRIPMQIVKADWVTQPIPKL